MILHYSKEMPEERMSGHLEERFAEGKKKHNRQPHISRQAKKSPLTFLKGNISKSQADYGFILTAPRSGQ
jgi:hypothetical protein